MGYVLLFMAAVATGRPYLRHGDLFPSGLLLRQRMTVFLNLTWLSSLCLEAKFGLFYIRAVFALRVLPVFVVVVVCRLLLESRIDGGL